MSLLDRFRDLLPVQEPTPADMRRRVYRRAPQVVWVAQRGTTILYDVERGTYESLNDVATTAWELLIRPDGATIDHIIGAIHREYDLPPEVGADRVELDVTALLMRLDKMQLIVTDQVGDGHDA